MIAAAIFTSNLMLEKLKKQGVLVLMELLRGSQTVLSVVYYIYSKRTPCFFTYSQFNAFL